MYVSVHLTCFHSNSLRNESELSLCYFQYLNLDNRTQNKSQYYNFIDQLTLVIDEQQLAWNFNWFLWIIMNCFCHFLWRWWRYETIPDILLTLDLEYVLLSLIDDNETSLWITCNEISEFWSVSMILSNKSSWMKKIHDKLKFHLDDMGYQLRHIHIPLKSECLHHKLNIFYQNKYHEEIVIHICTRSEYEFFDHFYS